MFDTPRITIHREPGESWTQTHARAKAHAERRVHSGYVVPLSSGNRGGKPRMRRPTGYVIRKRSAGALVVLTFDN